MVWLLVPVRDCIGRPLRDPEDSLLSVIRDFLVSWIVMYGRLSRVIHPDLGVPRPSSSCLLQLNSFSNIYTFARGHYV